MSYDVRLHDTEGNTLEVDRHSEGGTYAVGGETSANLNITYNYAEVYMLLDFSIRDLNRQRAGDMLGILRSMVAKLGTKRFTDYWAPTPGNAGYALSILLKWAEQHPDGVWEVS